MTKVRLWAVLGLIFGCAIALPLTVVALRAHELDDFEHYRSYPFMNRAYDAAKREDWEQVRKLMTHLLDQVPNNDEARALLINALSEQKDFEAALTVAQEYPEPDVRKKAVLDIQLRWIYDAPPSSVMISKWLEKAPSEREHIAIWQSFVARMDGDEYYQENLFDWLGSVQAKGDELALRRARANMAERLEKWDAVIDELAPLAQDNQLSADDWPRLANAYVEKLDGAALSALLKTAPNADGAITARMNLIERAIGNKQFDLAKAWLRPLVDDDVSNHTALRRLWELARQTEDADLVYQTSHELGRPCLETAEWLVGRKNGLVHALLQRCDASENPRSWLVLAQRVGAWDLMKTVPLQGTWDERRSDILVRHFLKTGQTNEAMAWLKKRQKNPATLRHLAQLHQNLGEMTLAAQNWYALYDLTGSYPALDQATYLDVQNGSGSSAMYRLEHAYQDAKGDLPHDLIERLALLYQQNLSDTDLPKVSVLLDRVDGKLRAELLSRLSLSGHCELVRDFTDKHTVTQAVSYRALGQCSMQKTPGVAVVYFREAVKRGDNGSVLPLAYAYDASGAYGQAMEIWNNQPVEQLGNNAALTAAHSAMNDGQFDRAEAFWAQVEPDTAAGWALGASIAAARQMPDVAMARQREALTFAPVAEDYYAAAAIALSADDTAQSTEWLQSAFDLSDENPRFRADLGMRLAGDADPDRRLQAVPYVEKAVHDYPEDYRLHETLANLYNQQGRSADSRASLRAAIDLEQYPVINEPNVESVEARRYRQRRSHEALSRRDTVTVASTWSPAGVSANAIPGKESFERKAQSQNMQTFLWDHALGEEPVEAGKSLSVYGRAVLGADDRNKYASNFGTGVGLRYKPLGDYNLNLYGEVYVQSRLSDDRSLPFKKAVNPVELFERGGDFANDGNVTGDFLLRATASFFDQGEYRNDWRVDEDSWNERFLYLDAAWWTHSHSYQWLSRYQQGRTFKLPFESAQTLMPYGFTEFSTQKTNGDWRQDLRAGAGIRWQMWLDDDTYNAYRSHISARIEYQQGLGGNLYAKANGVFVGLEFGF